jgi:hypothetical protein
VDCSTTDIQDLITRECSPPGIDASGGVFLLSDVCSAGAGVELPYFSTIPDILVDDAEGADIGDCTKAAKYKQQQVTVMYTIPDDQAVTCTRDGYYIITMPNFQHP